MTDIFFFNLLLRIVKELCISLLYLFNYRQIFHIENDRFLKTHTLFLLFRQT